MRRSAAVDANQADIVADLRKMGCSVQLLHSVGAGCPDLLVGYRGANWLLEVKDENKQLSSRKLTGPQVNWHRDWRGQVAVVKNAKEAAGVIGLAAFYGE